MKGKKGQVFGYTIMLAMVVIILALSLTPAIKSFTDSAMNESTADAIGLNCSTTTDNFIKATCVITDFSLVYVGAGILLIGLGILTSRIAFS